MLVTFHRAARNYAAAGREQSLIVSRHRISFILNLYVTVMNRHERHGKRCKSGMFIMGCNQQLSDWIWWPHHNKKITFGTQNLFRSPRLGKSYSGKVTAVVLLTGHDVPVELLSKYLCLYPQIIAIVSFSQTGQFLQWVVVTTKTYNWRECSQ